MGQIYRYARPERPHEHRVDGLPNFYWHTQTDGTKKAKLERGISRLPVVATPAGDRVPTVLLRSTPWKAGAERVPWHDEFHEATGTVKYFGDNKIDERTNQPKADDPDDVLGNAYMRDHFREATSGDAGRRDRGGPVLLFTGVPCRGRPKGNVRFDGLGVVTEVSLVNQPATTTRVEYFNYAFTVQLFNLAADDWSIDWRWISGRRVETSPTGTTANSSLPRGSNGVRKASTLSNNCGFRTRRSSHSRCQARMAGRLQVGSKSELARQALADD